MCLTQFLATSNKQQATSNKQQATSNKRHKFPLRPNKFTIKYKFSHSKPHAQEQIPILVRFLSFENMRASALSLCKKQSSTYKKYACGCFLHAPSICSAYFQKFCQHRHGCRRMSYRLRQFNPNKIKYIESPNLKLAGIPKGRALGSAGRRERVLGRERKPCSERGVLSLPKKTEGSKGIHPLKKHF